MNQVKLPMKLIPLEQQRKKEYTLFDQHLTIALTPLEKLLILFVTFLDNHLFPLIH